MRHYEYLVIVYAYTIPPNGGTGDEKYFIWRPGSQEPECRTQTSFFLLANDLSREGWRFMQGETLFTVAYAHGNRSDIQPVRRQYVFERRLRKGRSEAAAEARPALT